MQLRLWTRKDGVYASSARRDGDNPARRDGDNP